MLFPPLAQHNYVESFTYLKDTKEKRTEQGKEVCVCECVCVGVAAL